MSANIYERIMCTGDYVADGGQLDGAFVGNCVALWASGTVTAAWIKDICQMSTAQSAQLDELLATQPSTGLLASLVNAKAVSQWPDKVRTILVFAATLYANFDTVAEVKAALGVS